MYILNRLRYYFIPILVHRSIRDAYWNTSGDKSVIRRPHPSLFHSASDLSVECFHRESLNFLQGWYLVPLPDTFFAVNYRLGCHIAVHHPRCVPDKYSLRRIIRDDPFRSTHTHRTLTTREMKSHALARSIDMNEISRRSKFNFRLLPR